MNPWPHESRPDTATQRGSSRSTPALGNSVLGTTTPGSSKRGIASQRKEQNHSPAEIETKWAKHERRNYQAARIILASPQLYSGLPLEWAKLFLAAHHPTKQAVARHD